MKMGKAPGSSGMVVEMIRAANDMGASMIRDLAAAIIHVGKVPSDWEQSFIVCLCKGYDERGCIGKGKLLLSQADRAGHESPGGDCGQPHQTVGVNQQSLFGSFPGRGTKEMDVDVAPVPAC